MIRSVHTWDLLAAVEAMHPLTRASTLALFEVGPDAAPPVRVGTETEGLADEAFTFRWTVKEPQQVATLAILRRALPTLRSYYTCDALWTDTPTWTRLP